MTEVAAVHPTGGLVAENAAMLSRFEEDGVPIDRVADFDFIVEFSSKQKAIDYRTAIRPLIKATAKEHGLKDYLLFILCSYDDEGRYEIRLSTEMVPDAAHISALEAAMASLASEHGGSDVSWEFADPRNSEVDA